MAFVIVRLAGDGAPIGQLQIALRAFERLKSTVFRRPQARSRCRARHVEPNDLGGLGRKFRVIALTPGFAPRQVDLLGAQETPNILHMNVAKPLGDQRPGPVGVAFRRRSVEQRQDAPVRLPVVSASAPRSPTSENPRSRSFAYRTRHFDAVPVVQPARGQSPASPRPRRPSTRSAP